MGALSIALNLFTIILVLFFIFITFLSFNTRDDMNETWLQTLRRVLSSSQGVNSAILSKPSLYGNIGEFVGKDWQTVPYVSIADADNQDSLDDFMETVTPNMVGTGGIFT